MAANFKKNTISIFFAHVFANSSFISVCKEFVFAFLKL